MRLAPLLSLASIVALLLLGFALLATSQVAPRRTLGVLPLDRRNRLVKRGAAVLLFLVGLVLSIARDGAGFGVLLWASAASLCALTVTCVLSYRPGWLKPLVRSGRT